MGLRAWAMTWYHVLAPRPAEDRQNASSLVSLRPAALKPRFLDFDLIETTSVTTTQY
jgi:hypothetical protein